MSTRATTSPRPEPRQGGWLLAAMTALTLTAIVGAVCWQLWSADVPSRPATPPAVSTTARAATPTTLYLVNTDDEAARLWRELEVNPGADGRPAAAHAVVLATTSGTALVVGGMPVHVVDRRGITPDAGGGASDATDGARPRDRCGLDTETRAC